MADRVVLVTGASGGLGPDLVAGFLAVGDTVVAHSRTAESMPDSLRAGRIHPVHGDLTSDDDAQGIVDQAAALHGRIDVVVNAAADQGLGTPGPITIADWLHMLDATLVSAVRVTTYAVPHMPAGAAIVNISSVEAATAFPDHANYAAAKAGLEAYTRALSAELGSRGIRANAVAPGLIERPGLAEAWPQGHAWWSAATALRRPVSAAEVAEAVVFLAGATGITGVVLPVDAGWSASARPPF